MLASNADVEAAIMAVLVNLGAMLCAAVVAWFPLRRLRLSRSSHRSLYCAMAGFCGVVILANLLALAMPLGFWRLLMAYGALACIILWAIMRSMLAPTPREKTP